MPTGFPRRLIINGRTYRVTGTADRTPRWEVSRVPSQEGDPWRERTLPLGDGSAGIVGSHRHIGRPTQDGVADSTNGDTSVEDRYGAGPLVTTISLTSGNTPHAAGSIGGSLTIGGGGAPSIGGGAASGVATAIWADGADDESQQSRYIYVLVGGRLKVIDPTSDSVVETTEWAGVDGGDAARWANAWWIARRGGATDYVKVVTSPYGDGGGGTVLADTDYTAVNIHAGPDALYRAYNNFTGNSALIKKSTTTTVADADSDANWSPSSGETMGDPGISVTRLATLGEDLVVGKRDGLYEFDSTFTARTAIEWMRNFQWRWNCNAILPLGQNREVLVAYRRGLYFLPTNAAVGTEALTGNETDKKGRYTALAFDGNWIYAFLGSTATDDTHLIKMRPRRRPGPGIMEHHPIVTRTGKEVLACFVWPGATVSGTTYGPRLYWGDGTDTLAYIRLGETQPDVLDSNARFATAWTIQWPHDDFGTPQSLKMPYKVEATYSGVTGTPGVTWAVSADGAAFVNLDSDGSGSGTAAVSTDGFAQRFGNRANTTKGRELTFRVSGAGGSSTTQQHVQGTPIVTLLEQPEMIDEIDVSLELRRDEMNDEDGEAQWRTVKALSGSGPYTMLADYGDSVAGTTFYGRVTQVRRAGSVVSADAPGTIVAVMKIRALDFS